MKHIIIFALLALSLSACVHNNGNTSLTPEQAQRESNNMSEVQTRD